MLSPSGGNIYCLSDVVHLLCSKMLGNDWSITGEIDETRKVIVNYFNF